jgi:hypothetical protein
MAENLAQGDYDSAEHLYQIQGPCHSLLLASIDSVPRRNGLGLYVLASTFFAVNDDVQAKFSIILMTM